MTSKEPPMTLIMPVLSKGKHRSPDDGGCFMEMASWLAGEEWSDKPECTDPVPGELARVVNDLLSDGRRHKLAPLIPAVVGLTVDDPQERRLAQVAVAAWCVRQIPDLTDIREHVEAVAAAEAWVACPCFRHAADAYSAAAYGNTGRVAWAAKSVATAAGAHSTVAATEAAARAVAHSAVAVVYPAVGADDRLVALLAGAIDLWRVHTGHAPAPVDPDRWRQAVGLVGAV